jgi:hypothetical protein
VAQKPKVQFPDADEETLVDTLEGLTDFHEIVAIVVRSQLEDLSLAAALRGRMGGMHERLVRLKDRLTGSAKSVGIGVPRTRATSRTEVV